jgi:hypothetical protein
VIIGQRDTNPKTLAALEAAIAAHQELGREVWLTPPPAGFKDVNEALMEGARDRPLGAGRGAHIAPGSTRPRCCMTRRLAPSAWSASIA